jgi:hypothetical protein
MDVDWNAELVDQLEWHWGHQLRPRLDGLTDDEYFWPPGSGAVIRGEHSPVSMIAWRLRHVIDVFGSPTVPHFETPPTDRPAVVHSGTADGALRQLDEAHDAWVRDVRGLGVPGIARPQGALSPPEYADAPMARLVMYVHLEVIHHGAEICLLRDLYSCRGRS